MFEFIMLLEISVANPDPGEAKRSDQGPVNMEPDLNYWFKPVQCLQNKMSNLSQIKYLIQTRFKP